MFCEPTPQHAFLAALAGDWTYEGECSMGPDQPWEKNSGKESGRTLGDLWLLLEGEVPMQEGAVGKTLFTLGYDVAKQLLHGHVRRVHDEQPLGVRRRVGRIGDETEPVCRWPLLHDSRRDATLPRHDRDATRWQPHTHVGDAQSGRQLDLLHAVAVHPSLSGSGSGVLESCP